MQYYVLRMAMPDVTIKMLRDDEPVPTADGVYLVTAASFPRRTAERCDLVVNCDSFPEMGDDICRNYFDAIAERSRLLFSINQEANGPLSNNVNGPRQPVVTEMIGPPVVGGGGGGDDGVCNRFCSHEVNCGVILLMSG